MVIRTIRTILLQKAANTQSELPKHHGPLESLMITLITLIALIVGPGS